MFDPEWTPRPGEENFAAIIPDGLHNWYDDVCDDHKADEQMGQIDVFCETVDIGVSGLYPDFS